MSRAKRESTGKFPDCNLHQSKILKSSAFVSEPNNEKSVSKYFVSSEGGELCWVDEACPGGQLALELEPDEIEVSLLAGAEKKPKTFFFFQSIGFGTCLVSGLGTYYPNLF